MDRVLILEKIESLQRCLQRVHAKRASTVAELAADIDRQDILVLNLSRAVQLCVDIAAHIVSQSQQAAPATMGESFQRLADMHWIDEETAMTLRRAVGFRNIAVHNYDAIDWEIVHAISHVQLPVFQSFVRQVTEGLENS